MWRETQLTLWRMRRSSDLLTENLKTRFLFSTPRLCVPMIPGKPTRKKDLVWTKFQSCDRRNRETVYGILSFWMKTSTKKNDRAERGDMFSTPKKLHGSHHEGMGQGWSCDRKHKNTQTWNPPEKHSPVARWTSWVPLFHSSSVFSTEFECWKWEVLTHF